jgi:DNA repair protein RecO (recombination protein O)
MIVKTEAIVLKRMNYGETSQIITLFTRNNGKISVLAKGSRTPKSKFGASLQPLTYSQVVFYHKTTRDLQTLSDSTILVPLYDLQRTLPKIEIGMQVIELVQNVMEEGQPNQRLFKLMLEVLATLNDAQHNLGNLLFYFRLMTASILGFDPNIDKNKVQMLDEKGGWWHISTGEILPLSEASSGMRGSKLGLRALAIIARADLDTITRMVLTPELSAEVNEMTTQYLQFHIENLRQSRVGKVFGEMHTP